MGALSVNKNLLREAFGLPEAPVLMTRSLKKAAMIVTEVRSDQPNFGITKSLPYDDAFLVGVQLRDCPVHELWVDGRPVPVEPIMAGKTLLYDLRRDPIAHMTSPFHSVHFYLPRNILDSIADDVQAPRIGDLIYKNGIGMDDPVCRQLLSSLAPALAKPAEANTLFVDHVALALGAHVANVYGGMRIAQRASRGGLAPYQERRAKELLTENLNGEVTLSQLAAECGLSVRHFTRAFRQSTGVPPHRWLLIYRVERAKELLRTPTLSLAEAALACGFADQSHFTRVFVAVMGVSPGAWRRMIMET